MMLESQISCQWVQAFARLNRDLRTDSDPGEILELMTKSAIEASGADLGLVFLGPSTPWMCEVAKGVPELVGGYLGSTLNISHELAEPRLGDASQLVPLGFTDNTPLLGSAMFVPIYNLDEHDDEETSDDLELPASPSGIIVLAKRAGDVPFSEANLQGANAFISVCANLIGLLQSKFSPSLSAEAIYADKLAKISRDLHDLVIQQLFATGMELASLQHKIKTKEVSKASLMQVLKTTQNNLDEAIRQIRVLVDGIKESSESAPLIEGIITEASRARGALGFAPTLLFVLDDRILDPEQADWPDQSADMCARVGPEITQNVVAVVREALSNVARHAQARAASVRVTVNGTGPTGELILAIVDDGVGMDAQNDRRSGLSNMRRRAAEHSGSFSISAGPRGHGISVVWRVPLLVLPLE